MEKSLEAELRASGSRATGELARDERQGGNALSTRERCCTEREAPERRDPGHGCGTKQAREPDRGVNRREAENAWGRTEAGGLETSRNTGVPCAGAGEIRSEARVSRANDQWTRAGEVVMRVETLVGK